MPSPSAPPAELTAALESAVVRELRAAWRQLNESYFRGGLEPPTIELVPVRSTLGRWIAATRTLEISRPLVVEQPWAAVIEVLKHEMAHQYVCEVLHETSQTPHGPAFRDACARLGVEARASGVPDVGRAEGEDRAVARITRLLALAESPNRHEAEAAMAAAQRLMLKHNLEVVQSASVRDYAFAHLGQPSGRIGEHERMVAMILGKHFFVEVIWIPVYRPLAGKRGSVLEICGTQSNVATAVYVHGFLHQTAERLWSEHKAARGIASNRERRTYLAGVMTGFADKLAKQSAQNRSEGLVWVRDGDLEVYFRRRHPHVRHVRHSGQRRTSAWADGREAGHGIVLHRPIDAAPAALGKLLSGKR
ncbi:MAG: SprT-like domain-containing protein [Polyangiaceae bacterium]|nr:SprT-like domain-containing protein [Polyangiaceae bacterium]